MHWGDSLKIIVTSALPYVYSIPHLGNITGSVLPADVYYKYLLMAGEDAIYICGSDQHGTAIELAAIKLGIEPEKLANDMHEKLKTAFGNFGITFTYYGKTHTEQNKEVTYEIFNALNNNGFIIANEKEHPYCEFDKRFLADRFIEGKCPYCGAEAARGDQCDNCGRLINPKDIIDPHCKICGKKQIVFKKTKNLAIDYAKLQPKIKEFVDSSIHNNWSRNAITKTESYISEGLRSVDITRNIKWGFPVPLKGYEDSVMYVWYDAPLGYIGITKEWDAKKWENYWKDGKTRLVQFMGKDNIQFHTIHWPGMLIGANKGYVLPYTIRASEFLTTTGGLKFSKSSGRGLNVVEVLNVLPADYWRFVLVYIYPETSDSEFSIPVFTEIVNNIMNDKIGNFIHRVLTLAKANESKLGQLSVQTSPETADTIGKYKAHFEKTEIREALRAVVEIADQGNSMMNLKAPWKLAKENSSEFAATMASLLRIAHTISILLYPFSPSASAKALSYFKTDRTPKLSDIGAAITLDMQNITPIFTKVDEQVAAKLAEFSK